MLLPYIANSGLLVRSAADLLMHTDGVTVESAYLEENGIKLWVKLPDSALTGNRKSEVWDVDMTVTVRFE
jgi:hypothetical protein